MKLAVRGAYAPAGQELDPGRLKRPLQALHGGRGGPDAVQAFQPPDGLHRNPGGVREPLPVDSGHGAGRAGRLAGERADDADLDWLTPLPRIRR